MIDMIDASSKRGTLGWCVFKYSILTFFALLADSNGNTRKHTETHGNTRKHTKTHETHTKVLATGSTDGVMQFVHNSKPVSEVLAKYDNQILAFFRDHYPAKKSPKGRRKRGEAMHYTLLYYTLYKVCVCSGGVCSGGVCSAGVCSGGAIQPCSHNV
jgi:hypothetical protein